MMNQPLKVVDREVYDLNQKEIQRQFQCLELIASENFPSLATLSAVSSHFNNKYAEGYPGARYYGGTQVVDKLETLCQKRALKVFNLNNDEWGVNVQALSGSPANLAVYTALVPPGGKIMGLSLNDGGHLTHGYQRNNRHVSASSLFWKSLSFNVDRNTQRIDYEGLRKKAIMFRPNLIIAGASAYPRNIDYQKFKKIADDVGAILMSDIAHISGLVCAGIGTNPFDYSDIVTTTTHKTLRSIRGAMIFYRRKYEKKINSAVFPGLQGGPHMHQIAGICVSLKEALTPEFKEYQYQTVKNMKALANFLMKNGIDLVTGGTDNHLALLNLKKNKIDGARVEFLLDCANITTNKNTIPGDKNVGMPMGLRIGTPALTTRGLNEKDFEKVGEFIIEGIEHSKRIKKSTKKLKEFKKAALNDTYVNDLKKRVISFITKFPLPGLF